MVGISISRSIPGRGLCAVKFMNEVRWLENCLQKFYKQFDKFLQLQESILQFGEAKVEDE